ncbi:MAG: hypothetical protein E7I60_06055 [Veillonella parvula]|nr:hypothetical protein [Veillonella parvula]
MNHQVDNMHRKDNDQSMRPEGENHQMRQQCNNHQMPPQDQPSHDDRHNDNVPQQQTDQGAPQTTQN